MVAQKADYVVWSVERIPIEEAVGSAITECARWQPSEVFSAMNDNDYMHVDIESLILFWDEYGARITTHQGCKSDCGQVCWHVERDLLRVINAVRVWKAKGSFLFERHSSVSHTRWDFSWYGDDCWLVTTTANGAICILDSDGQSLRSARREE